MPWAVYLATSSDSIDYGDAGLDSATSFVCSFDFRPSDLDGVDADHGFILGSHALNPMYHFLCHASDTGELVVYIGYDTGGYPNLVASWTSGSPVFANGVWTHVLIDFDGSRTGDDRLRITVDGTRIETSGTYSGSMPASIGNSVGNCTFRVGGPGYGGVGGYQIAVDNLVLTASGGVSHAWLFEEVSSEEAGGTPSSLTGTESGTIDYVAHADPGVCNDLTFAQSIAAEDASFVVYATIEGCGDSTGLWRFCSTTPHFAQADGDAPDIAHWREWLAEWPRILEEGDPGEQGGVLDAGELELAIVDIDDTLTREWRTEGSPETYLTEDLTADETSVDVVDASGISTGDVIYVASEAMVVTAKASNTLTVTRGALDTTAVAIATGSPVYTALPYLLSRRVRLYVVNAESCSEDEAREVGQYRLDAKGLDDGLNIYQLRAAGQLLVASALVSRRTPNRYKVLTYNPGRRFIVEPRAFDNAYPEIPFWDSADPRAFVRFGDEIAIAENVALQGSQRPIWEFNGRAFRGVLGTSVDSSDTQDTIEVVFGADGKVGMLDSGDQPTFFRYSPGPTPSTSRTSGTWIASCNWIDIILNLLLSSAGTEDVLELANRINAYGAWDCLPPGVGIGYRAAGVDFDAALSIRARTPDYLFPNFYVGAEPVKFGELITDHFLRPVGAYLSTSGGQLRIVMPRIPLRGDTSFTLGSAEILSRSVGARQYGMGVKVFQDMSRVATSIAYKIGAGDLASTLIVNNADFDVTYGSKGYKEHEARRISIDVPSARPDTDGSSEFLRNRAMALVARGRYPATTIQLSAPLALWDASVGDIGELTHAQIPDPASGVRGVTGMQCELVSRRIQLNPESSHVEMTLRADRMDARVGAIAPCCCIVSVASGGGGTFEITVESNRFTEDDAGLAGLPATDAAAFAVGDVLELRDVAGVSVAGTQSITALAGDVITVDGDWGTALGTGTGNAGQVLGYATATDAVSAQTEDRVYLASNTDRTIDGSSDRPWNYGEV